MPTLTVTEDQLRLISKALDLYARIGICQFTEIKNHPSIQRMLEDKLRPQKELEVGDRTDQGVVIEIDTEFVKTKGTWSGVEEIKTWKSKPKLSPDWNLYHDLRREADTILNDAKKRLVLDNDLTVNSSYSIYNEIVDESCRVAYDIQQVIRHEFWKANSDKSFIGVDSSVSLSTKDSEKIKCNID